MSKMTMPMAVFGGLALIAAAIFFGQGTNRATATDHIQKVAVCSIKNDRCLEIAGIQEYTGGTEVNGLVVVDWSTE